MSFRSSPPPPGEAGDYSSAWDDYVRRSRVEGVTWPGDEWGDARLWSAWFSRLFEPYGVSGWNFAVEIGQGAGKYTQPVLGAGDARVLCLDVSPKFQAVCASRLRSYIDAGRLLFRVIDERDPDALARSVRDAGWDGRVDAVYSIDTMVHLTWTQIAAFILSATEILRVGGVFIGTFADATSALGIEKLISDLDRVVRGGGTPATNCFHWSSPEVVRALAEKCGFKVEICDLDPEHRRDGHVVLRFVDPDVAAACRSLRVRSA